MQYTKLQLGCMLFLEAKEEIIDLMNKGMEKSDDRI